MPPIAPRGRGCARRRRRPRCGAAGEGCRRGGSASRRAGSARPSARAPPAGHHAPASHTRPASKPLTLEHAATLLKAAEGARFQAYLVLSLLTGLRTEEIHALGEITSTW